MAIGGLTNEDLRELARQCVEWLKENGDTFDGDEWAMMQVARAYLAEHPDDEDEPLTEEWWKEVFPFSKEESCVHCYFNLGLTNEYRFRYFDVDGSEAIIPIDGTRGHVRRLCKELGFPLRENEVNK